MMNSLTPLIKNRLRTQQRKSQTEEVARKEPQDLDAEKDIEASDASTNIEKPLPEVPVGQIEVFETSKDVESTDPPPQN